MQTIDDNFFTIIKAAIKEHVHNVSDITLYKISDSISEIAGGEMVYVSRSSRRQISERNKLIKIDRMRGLSTERLSIKYSLSTSHILRIIRQA